MSLFDREFHCTIRDSLWQYGERTYYPKIDNSSILKLVV